MAASKHLVSLLHKSVANSNKMYILTLQILRVLHIFIALAYYIDPSAGIMEESIIATTPPLSPVPLPPNVTVLTSVMTQVLQEARTPRRVSWAIAYHGWITGWVTDIFGKNAETLMEELCAKYLFRKCVQINVAHVSGSCTVRNKTTKNSNICKLSCWTDVCFMI